jgi:uncharacterized protein YndB with AHSA1/START domain
MDKARFVYVTYINTTPEKVWAALMDPEMTRKYWVNHRNASDWKVGSRWEHQDFDDPTLIDIVGKVVESDPPRRLVLTWAGSKEAADPASYSRVTFEIERDFEAVRLTVTHDELQPDSKMRHGITRGWPVVLSSLKTLLETGQPLPGTTRRWTNPASKPAQ